ncbi:MAG TPA: ATP-binding protein [Gemmatimonadaceae bacterium]|nr:ATP-binding protein [Gemmatimonadaceae bacterium]
MSEDPEALEYTPEVERLIRRLSETERELQRLGAGELDAVVDPASASTIVLRNAQQAIVQSEARFRDLINRCPALVCEISPEGRILFANDAGRAILGYHARALDDAPWWTTLVADGDRHMAQRLIAVARQGDVTGFELPLRTRDEEVRWFLVNTANRYDAAGDLQMVVVFGLDITERKQAEEASRQLAEAQLARSEAEASNKAKTEFLAVMSHELRTPLNAIGGYAELIEMGLRGPVTPAQVEDIKKIRRSQRHLLGLINDIMNFARLETGHVSLEVRDISVNETLAVLDALTEPQVASKGIRYARGRCDPGLTAWADEEKTRQILINLVSNAIKFTERGGEITIACESDQRSVRFHVRDTGRGIPSEKLEAIFEPFVQVNKQFTRDEGVGLGLAISRDLARMMRGELTAESVLGDGSHFTLTLPRTKPG